MLTPLGSTISINPSGRLAELAADTPGSDRPPAGAPNAGSGIAITSARANCATG
jgi:hypothetical protein